MIPASMHMQTIRDLLAPIDAYLGDASVSEILINGPNDIFVERQGKLERTAARFEDEEAVLCALRAIAQYAGQLLDDRAPVLEARLPDGSRVEAIASPVALHGPAVAIRRFSRNVMALPRLVELGSLPLDAAQLLQALVQAKCNIVVAGGTGSGKTSLLNVLGSCIPERERVLVIEDTRELSIEHDHVVYLEARKPNDDGEGDVSIRDLFRACLRMRPDRIVVGEIRGAEALDMVQAMVSGHGGGLTTLHATYPHDTLSRIETMCLMSDVALPLSAIRMQIGSGIEVIVQVSRLRDGSRKITHITEVVDFDVERGTYELVDLYVRRSRDSVSELRATGRLPTFAARLQEEGSELPETMLHAARNREAHHEQ